MLVQAWCSRSQRRSGPVQHYDRRLMEFIIDCPRLMIGGNLNPHELRREHRHGCQRRRW
jgi:hypothetical protein